MLLWGGGHLLIFESAPYKADLRFNPNFMVVRERSKWIDIFENEGCTLVYEQSYPKWGVELLSRITRFSVSLYYILQKKRNKQERATVKKQDEQDKTQKILYGGYKIIRTITFAISYP